MSCTTSAQIPSACGYRVVKSTSCLSVGCRPSSALAHRSPTTSNTWARAEAREGLCPPDRVQYVDIVAKHLGRLDALAERTSSRRGVSAWWCLPAGCEIG